MVVEAKLNPEPASAITPSLLPFLDSLKLVLQFKNRPPVASAAFCRPTM